MREDLKGLEISRNELQILTNLPVNNELINILHPLQKFLRNWLVQIQGSEGVTVLVLGLTVIVLAYIVFDAIMSITFATSLHLPSWLLLLIFALVCGLIAQVSLYLIWKHKLKIVKENMTPCLQILLNEVERYNAIIQAIDINDQIEAAGNIGVEIKERRKVIEALKLTRKDLVRALKTERIFRENKKFIIKNTDLFSNNLASLTAMQVAEQASEHGKLLNEALKIALDVQQEMRRLESQR